MAERSFGRTAASLRPVSLERQVMKNAAGSCLVKFGDTHVLCAATIEETLPGWRKNAHAGWVTAEYAMLPASTGKRSPREQKGRKGRSMEIERLVGRSLRTVCDLRAMGEITVTVDCDVLQADGGTRTASITCGWVALHDALMSWVKAGHIHRLPLKDQVAAVSCGVVAGELLCDLDYPEDSAAELDLNLVGTGSGQLVEIQGTGEKAPFDRATLNSLLDMGEAAIQRLVALQNEVTNFRTE